MAKTILTGSQELIRDINTQSVIRTITEHEPISRAAISTKLGLTKATVSAIVQVLLDRELVLEIGSDDTKKGRKPILLQMNRKCAHIVSVDLSSESLTIMTSDLLGGNCSVTRLPSPSRKSLLAETLIKGIQAACDALPPSRYGLIGIAIGIHGVVHHNRIIFMPYSDFSDTDILTPLQEAFHVPVILENEANLSVLGEWHHFHHTNEMLYISIHSGIGVGIIMKDQLVKGKNGYAGEFGHTIVQIGGKQCPCGNRGCLEQYASERALFARLSWEKHRTITPDYFEQLYREKDPFAMQLLDEFIQYMAVGINNMLNTFNPDIIVLNTILTRCKPDLCDEIRNHLRSNMKNYCRLIPSVLQDASILLGGAYLIQKQFLYPNQIQ